MMQPTLALLVAGLPISSQQHPYLHKINTNVDQAERRLARDGCLSAQQPTDHLCQLEVGVSDISFRQPVMDRLSSLDGRLRHLRNISFSESTGAVKGAQLRP